jgi:arylformamidase
MMTVLDISRTLVTGTAVWPGDTPYGIAKVLERSQGHAVNLTTLTLSAHTGSHVDAPLHFADVDESIDQMDLGLYWGPAQIVTSARPTGPLYPDDFDGYDLTLAPRLLVRSPASELDQTVFPTEYVYPSPELAAHLAGQGVILFGSDAPSMDAMDSKSLMGHNALLHHGIAILEWLDLRDAADGRYELVALPLKIAGGDGSPVRAALREYHS